MTVHPPSAEIQKLAKRLIGTTGQGDLADEVNELNLDECAALDRLAFECVICGWWFTAHERVVVNDEWMCDGCAD